MAGLLAGHHSLVYEDDDIDDDDEVVGKGKRGDNAELTIYSEEGIADMDLPDNILLEDLDYLDNITSCNKVENCVMLSEYEQNLIKETEGPYHGHHGHRKPRKWSLFRQPTLTTIQDQDDDDVDDELSMTIGVGGVGTRPTFAEEGVRKRPFHYSSSPPGSASSSSRSRGFLPKAGNPGVIPTFNNRYTGKYPKRSITVIEETSM